MSAVMQPSFLAAGKDYRAIIPRIVHFPGEAPHTSQQCININILDDEEFEGEKPESFSLSLSVNDIAVVVRTSSATVFIVDDETDGGTLHFRAFSGFSVGFHIDEKFTIFNLITKNLFPGWNWEYCTHGVVKHILLISACLL